MKKVQCDERCWLNEFIEKEQQKCAYSVHQTVDCSVYEAATEINARKKKKKKTRNMCVNL